MNQETRSDAEISAERLRNMKPHPDYKPVQGLPIPAQNGLLIKQIHKSKIFESLVQLEGGGEQKIFGAVGENTQDTCEGIIMAVGPNCSAAPRVGLKIQFSSMAGKNATIFRHKLEAYLGMDEYSIHFYIPDETTIVDNGVKEDKQLRREKSMYKNQKTLENVHKDEQYKKDVASDKTKGKIRVMKTK